MARAYPSSSHELLKEVCERLSWIILVGYDHLDAPVPKYFFCRGVWTVREDIGLWSDGCQRRAPPHLRQSIKQKPDVEVRQAVADKEDGIAQYVVAQLDVQWRIEVQPLVVTGL